MVPFALDRKIYFCLPIFFFGNHIVCTFYSQIRLCLWKCHKMGVNFWPCSNLQICNLTTNQQNSYTRAFDWVFLTSHQKKTSKCLECAWNVCVKFPTDMDWANTLVSSFVLLFKVDMILLQWLFVASEFFWYSVTVVAYFSNHF